jgi:hypothetical protein
MGVTFLAQPAELKPDPPKEGEALREQPGAGFNKFLAVHLFFELNSSFYREPLRYQRRDGLRTAMY